MTKIILPGVAMLVFACAHGKASPVAQTGGERAAEETAVNRGGDHPLYVGRGTDGELVMASTHHDAMNGVAVASSELGVTGKDDPDLVCKRETITGTHVPQWICRFKSEVEQDRIRTQQMLDKMPKACMDRSCFGN
jgi:hypothetical protein